jgi:hypothetical protein
LQFKEKCENRSNESFVQKLKELLFVNWYHEKMPMEDYLRVL